MATSICNHFLVSSVTPKRSQRGADDCMVDFGEISKILLTTVQGDSTCGLCTAKMGWYGEGILKPKY